MDINPMQHRRIKPFKGKMRGSKMDSTETGTDGLLESFLTNFRDSCNADFKWRFVSFFAHDLSVEALAAFFRAEDLGKTNTTTRKHRCNDGLNRISKSRVTTDHAQQTPTRKRYHRV